MAPEAKSVKIPAELYGLLSSKLEQAGATSVDELVSRVVRDWLTKREEGSGRKQAAMSQKDQKVIEERLKSLGYL